MYYFVIVKWHKLFYWKRKRENISRKVEWKGDTFSELKTMLCRKQNRVLKANVLKYTVVRSNPLHAFQCRQ